MILDQKKTTLAYRCPSCGAVPTSMVGAFSLSGDLFKLKCDCGGSFMTVERLQDGKLRLTVPCSNNPQERHFGHLLSPSCSNLGKGRGVWGGGRLEGRNLCKFCK